MAVAYGATTRLCTGALAGCEERCPRCPLRLQLRVCATGTAGERGPSNMYGDLVPAVGRPGASRECGPGWCSLSIPTVCLLCRPVTYCTCGGCTCHQHLGVTHGSNLERLSACTVPRPPARQRIHEAPARRPCSSGPMLAVLAPFKRASSALLAPLGPLASALRSLLTAWWVVRLPRRGHRRRPICSVHSPQASWAPLMRVCAWLTVGE